MLAEGQWTSSVAAVATKGFNSEACAKGAQPNDVLLIKAVAALKAGDPTLKVESRSAAGWRRHRGFIAATSDESFV